MSGQQCRVCGCTDENCTTCIARTGHPCSWVKPDLCSACASPSHELCADLAEYLATALEAPGALIVLLDKHGSLHVGCATAIGDEGKPMRGLVTLIDRAVLELLEGKYKRAEAGT